MKRSVTHYEVPFFDVDAYRIVWHGNYAKYFEIARCALLEEAGCPYLEMEKQGYFFPVVDLQVKYVKPMLFKQKVRIEAWFAEWQHSLKIKYEIRDCETNEVYTKAQTKQFAISIPDHVTQFESPSFLVNCVDAWLADDA
ncbi:acyl-CoA thioesterase [Alteromonas halophila]|uniref:4-hydroxybenzoyl-CoA thioesterase n=1 Tax=Alteromonas halophila TaxID=516698 RepID=A0A918JLG4_9ALTE|nr:acyl-CoA thioesterase [Alteromonas halophila]GGW84974.1 4-hydroxybenzoyl-CoA thioesterase [Alteromonas halophila]